MGNKNNVSNKKTKAEYLYIKHYEAHSNGNPLILLFQIRKSLVVTWLLTFLSLDDKLHLLPVTCVNIKNFTTSTGESHHFYNLFKIDLIPNTAALNR